MDTRGKRARSRLMKKMKPSGNKSTEKRLATIMRRHGITGWRRQHTGLPGKPDFYFPAKKVVVFVDGCFWHGCPKCYKAPKTRVAFWKKKNKDNR